MLCYMLLVWILLLPSSPAVGTIPLLLTSWWEVLVFMISGHIILPLSWQVLCMCRLFYLTWNAFSLRLVHSCCPSHGWRHWAKNLFRVNNAELWLSQPLLFSPFLVAAFPSLLNWLFPWQEEILPLSGQTPWLKLGETTWQIAPSVQVKWKGKLYLELSHFQPLAPIVVSSGPAP